MRITIKELLTKRPDGQSITIKGWIRNKRSSRQVTFLIINDGSTLHNLQVVIDTIRLAELPIAAIGIGASVAVTGKINPSQGGEQATELQAEHISMIGTAVDYPLQPKKHSLEFLREIAHLRFRTNTFGAIFRIRHAISYAVHQFFHARGFIYLHTPIITAIDAEGAGHMFGVSTLDMRQVPKKADGQVDFKKDFFGQKTSLTVSGQLEGEAAALGLGAIYTFGPTFRAENSNTTRHLAEFWMIEPEVAFYELADIISLAVTFLRHLIQFTMGHCADELHFLQKRELEAGVASKETPIPLLERLKQVCELPFIQITYTEAISILQEANQAKQQKFTYPIDAWGIDLQTEHERYLTEHYFKRPVIITHYPRAIKAFYMRQEEDGRTVSAMDIVFPGIGEIIGGSQREERLSYLQEAMRHASMNTDALQWYLDTRIFGSVPHSGFGLGLERLVQFVTGMDNIRDVIPFPRTPGNASF
jgi:asparaginyl-tRNA synthetase